MKPAVLTPLAVLSLALLIALAPEAGAQVSTGSTDPAPAAELEAVEQALTRSGRRQQDSPPM